MSPLGPLPPIDVTPALLPKHDERPAAEQRAIEAELDALHMELGVRPGHALQEAMTPELRVPYEKLMSAAAAPMASAPAEPAPSDVSMASAPADAEASTPQADVEAPASLAAPAVVEEVSESTPLPALLALPAPQDASSGITLQLGESVTLDHLGPVVVNTDGTLSRITNWHQMEEAEQQVVKRRIAKRNVDRLKQFRDRGDLKSDLVSALSEPDAGQ